MEEQAALPDEEYYQGDEEEEPVDFFTTITAEAKINPGFKALRDNETFTGARGIVEPMMRWYQDADGNFIEQFQTTGFDARIFELYLFAVFTEMDFEISRIHAVPDFVCSSPFGEFSVEAVTLNPSRDEAGNTVSQPPHDTVDEMRAYINEYMPIRFAGALKSKLEKKYWEKDHVAGKPLLFAVQDFSAPGSMMYTRSGFERYMAGYEHDYEKDADGKLIIKPKKVENHIWGTKIVPSGFFRQECSEHVSAVLFSNSGTISKFSRMGVVAGFGSPNVTTFRLGLAVDHDPNATKPRFFRVQVDGDKYSEEWREGIDIWHNPNALYPLDPDLLPGMAHHMIQPDGNVVSYTPDWHPLSSQTRHFLATAYSEPQTT